MRESRKGLSVVDLELQDDLHHVHTLAENGYATLHLCRDVGDYMQICAYVATFPTRKDDWRELKMWIAPQSPPELSATAMLLDLLKKKGKGVRLFCISGDQRLISLAQIFGFTLIEKGVLLGSLQPIDWSYHTGTVCRLPKSVHRPQSLHSPSDTKLLVLTA